MASAASSRLARPAPPAPTAPPAPSAEGETLTWIDVLRGRAASQGHLPVLSFLEDGERDVSRIRYDELDRRARAVAARMRAEGVRVGDRALLLYAPGLEYVVGFSACLYAGVVAVPAYPPDPSRTDRTTPRLLRIARDAEPALVLTQGAIAGLRDALPPDLARRRWLASDTVDEREAERWSEPGIGAEDLALLQYTSGSTGAPKGVMLSHRNLLENSRLIERNFEHGPRSQGVIWLPPYHDMGLIGGILQPLYAGFPTTLMSPLGFLESPLRWLRAVSRFGGTTSGGPNFAYELCVRRARGREDLDLDLTSWKVAFCGAEPIRSDTLERFAETFAPYGFRREAFYPCYGLAESTLMVSGGKAGAGVRSRAFHREALEAGRVAPAEDGTGEPRLVACGAPDPSGRLEIVDPDTRERRPTGRVGEIWVRGPSVAQGYWNQAAESEQTFSARIRGGPGEPYLRTGDLGFLHEGEVFVTGRAKDLIVVRGRNLAPQDLEASVERCHPSLRPGCCAAVPLVVDGEELPAIVQEVRNPSRPAEEMVDRIRGVVTDEHGVRVAAVALIAPRTIPKTTSGKVQRDVIRRRLLAGDLELVELWTRSGLAIPGPAGGVAGAEPTPERDVPDADLVARLRRCLDQVLPGQDAAGAAAHERLSRLGIDSLGAAELQHVVARELGVRVPLAAILRDASLETLAARVAAAAPDAGPAGPEVPPPAAPADPHAPFPLRPIQEAYLVGRTELLELGNVACRTYVELDAGSLDAERLEEAWNLLVERHDALRTVVCADLQQRVLADPPRFRVEVVDLREAPAGRRERELARARRDLSHLVRDPSEWPLFQVRVTRLPDRDRVHVGLDLLAVDGPAALQLARELQRLYEDPTAVLPRPASSFRERVLEELALRDAEAPRASRRFWRERLAAMPGAPELVSAPPPDARTPTRFERRRARLDAACWDRLRRRAAEEGLTPSALLLSAYAEVLAAWSRTAEFSVTVTSFDRPPRSDAADTVGDFTSALIVEGSGAPGAGFARRAAAVQEDLLAALEHARFGALEALRELGRTSGRAPSSRNVVFTSLLGVGPRAGAHPLAWLGEEVYGVSQTPQVILDNQVAEAEGALEIRWDAVEALFAEGAVEAMLDAYLRLLRELASGPQAWRGDTRRVVLGPEAQRRDAWNATGAPVPAGLLHEPFLRQADRFPERPALIHRGRSMRYGELAARSRRIGRRLRARGARPGRLVAVVMDKGAAQVPAVLGVLEAGAAYLPIDAALPPRRIRQLLERGEVELALTTGARVGSIDWPEGVTPLCVDRDDDRADDDDAPLEPVATPEDLAYVIFTSGSTGEPKGVMIDHRGALNTVLDVNERFGVGSGDRVLALSSMSFDLSVYDVFGVLAAGGTLVIPDADEARDPDRWIALAEEHGVSVWNSVPALMELLMERVGAGRGPHLPALRLVMLSGDWVPVTLPDRVRSLTGASRVVALGGATEASIWSIFHPVGRVDPALASIPYGRPLSNQRIHVLDASLEPRPVGVPGEIWIGGIGLASGYWRDPERTDERFRAHPRTGERLYRTGDWGRVLPDGDVEFLGRADSQVKISGYRVELAEVEAALARQPGVRAAAATAEGEARGEKRLVGYVVPRDADAPPRDAELRAALRDELPAYMIPSRLVVLGDLPLTANGKVDRSALTRPASDAPRQAPPARADDALVARICGIVAEVLGRDHVDPSQGIAELGTSSLDLLRTANRLKDALGSRPSLDEFTRLSTVEDLARFYARREGARAQRDAGCEPEPGTRGSGDAVLVDGEEREAFRRSEPGLRRDLEERETLPLAPEGMIDLAELRDWTAPLNHRSFADTPLSRDALAGVLGVLRRGTLEGRPKYRYGSAGGLYPVQTYVHVKAGRVRDTSPGTYYYDPRRHALVRLSEGERVTGELHWPANRDVEASAAFTLFLVADLAAIAPLYGDASRDFCLLETGAMVQLLATTAPRHGAGVCQIGRLDFAAVRDALALGADHALMTSLLGGPLAAEPAEPAAGGTGRGARGRSRDAAPRHDPVARRVTDLAREAEPGPAVAPERAAPGRTEAPERVLLTGASGFLGTRLLAELLAQTEARVLCALRARSAEEGLRRLREALARQGLGAPDPARVEVLPTDLGEPRLGLSASAWRTLAASVDAIYHNAARVSWITPYTDLRPVNVDGTHRLLELACTGRRKPLHFTSSIAVFPFSGHAFAEDHPLDHDAVLYGGYAQTKWVSEKLVARAAGRGLPVSVYRPVIVTGDTRTGRFNTHSYLERMIKGSIQLGAAPALDIRVDMAPVDFVARALVHISLTAPCRGAAYHLANPRALALKDLVDWIRSRGYALRWLPFEDWKRALFDSPGFAHNALHPFAPFLAHLEEGDSLMVQARCENTRSALAGSGIDCPPVDAALLGGYFDHFVETGFLPPPPA